MPSSRWPAAPASRPSEVFMFNGSRQSNNFTANAGGVGSTARVAISDVALEERVARRSPRRHGARDRPLCAQAHLVGILVLSRSLQSSCSGSPTQLSRASRAGSAGCGSLASRAAFRCWCSSCRFLGLLASPLFNTFSRTIETQADAYSLRTENRPDALSTALVKTAEYRYPRPGDARGDRLLRPPLGRAPRPHGDGVESRAPGAAHAIGEAFT